jgi:hypothetical protein
VYTTTTPPTFTLSLHSMGKDVINPKDWERLIASYKKNFASLIQPLGKQNGSKTSGILSMAEDSPMRAVSVSMMCTNLKPISHSYHTSVVAWAMEHILKLSINEGKNAQNWMHCCWVSLHFQISLLYCSFTIYICFWTIKQDQIDIWNIVLQGTCILEESTMEGKNIVDTEVTGIW